MVIPYTLYTYYNKNLLELQQKPCYSDVENHLSKTIDFEKPQCLYLTKTRRRYI